MNIEIIILGIRCVNGVYINGTKFEMEIRCINVFDNYYDVWSITYVIVFQHREEKESVKNENHIRSNYLRVIKFHSISCHFTADAVYLMFLLFHAKIIRDVKVLVKFTSRNLFPAQLLAETLAFCYDNVIGAKLKGVIGIERWKNYRTRIVAIERFYCDDCAKASTQCRGLRGALIYRHWNKRHRSFRR